jgi:hypothetical protein
MITAISDAGMYCSNFGASRGNKNSTMKTSAVIASVCGSLAPTSRNATQRSSTTPRSNPAGFVWTPSTTLICDTAMMTPSPLVNALITGLGRKLKNLPSPSAPISVMIKPLRTPAASAAPTPCVLTSIAIAGTTVADNPLTTIGARVKTPEIAPPIIDV